MITLRPNQETFDAAIRTSMRQYRRPLGVAPTGFGKRVWACSALIRCVEKGKRAMLVADRRLIVHQTRDECREHGIQYGIVMGDSPVNPDAPVQICTIQTLEKRNWRDNPPADVIFIDEAHKATGGYMRLLDQYPRAFVIGLTATPVGGDDKSLLGLFDVIVEPVKNTELIRDGWLLPTRVQCPIEPSMQGVKINYKTGEYSESGSAERIESMWSRANIWKYWEPYQDDATLVFVPRLAFGRFLVEQFRARGHAAEIIDGGTKQRDRDAILDRFNGGTLGVLISCDVLREAFDAPRARVGIDLQPNARLRTWWQKVGRLKRTFEGQENATLLDFSGNMWRLHIHPDENPEWPLDRSTTSAEIRKKSEPDGDPPPKWECPKCHYTLAKWERLDDGACPSCGVKLAKARRRVFMGDGTIKEVNPVQRKKKAAAHGEKQWMSILYPFWHTRKTMAAAAACYRQQTGQSPPYGSAVCPPRDDIRWRLSVRKAFPSLVSRRNTRQQQS